VPTLFSITNETDQLAFVEQRSGKARIIVKNLSGEELRAKVRLEPEGDCPLEWFSLEGAPERAFRPDQAHTFDIVIEAPTDAPPGRFRFRLDCASVADPDRTRSRGTPIEIQVEPTPVAPAPPPPEPRFDWRIPAAIVGGVIALAVGIWLLLPSSGPLRWVSAQDGSFPDDVVRVEGTSGVPICRGKFRSGLHPGELIGEACHFGYGGKEVTKAKYEVLAGDLETHDWEAARNGAFPEAGFSGGNEPGSPKRYLCRAESGGQLHTGKLVARWCNIPLDGKEVRVEDYEILVTEVGVEVAVASE